MDNLQNFFDDPLTPDMYIREQNFLESPSEILQALLKSKEEGLCIGVKSTSLASDTIITAVEDIHFGEGQTLIILKQYDSSGYILPSYKVDLSEIQSVYPFTTPFINPFLHNLDKDKSWFF